jgi:hypothetical protein
MDLSTSIVYQHNYQDLRQRNPALEQRIREGLKDRDPMALLQELKSEIHFTELAEVMGATYYLAEVVLPRAAQIKIGDDVLYSGEGHPYLRGQRVCVVAVHKGYYDDPDASVIVQDNAALAAAGGVTLADMVEVAPYVGDRVSFIASDARPEELSK